MRPVAMRDGRSVALAMDASIWLGVVQLPQFPNENSESSLCGGWHNSIAKESQLIGSIVCGDVQDGMVQPMGKPINVSTQRGLSLPVA